MQQHRSRHPVDALAPLLAFDASSDEGAVCRCGRHALIDHLHGQARFMADGRGKPLCCGSLGPARAIEPQWKPDDDPLGVGVDCGLGDPARQGLHRLGCEGRQRLRDGLGRIAQGDADAFRPGIDRQNPQLRRYGDAAGVGDAVEDGSVVGGGTPDCTT